jgi:putative PIN family toxin of toxin-antitoxin system
MRLVLDTNVIISALLFDGLPEQLLLRVLGGPHQLVLSPYIIAETSRVLETKFAVEGETLHLLQQFLGESEIVYFDPFLDVLADEPDNRILETAVKSRADYLVTGDKPLLALASYRDIQIVTSRDCLAIIH